MIDDEVFHLFVNEEKYYHHSGDSKYRCADTSIGTRTPADATNAQAARSTEIE